MIDSPDNHAPTPEFTEFLARDIVRTLRHDSRFVSPPRRAGGRTGRLRTAAALAIGLITGIATAVASTQVADARQREEIASTTGAKRELASVQLGLARANYDQVRRAFEKGAITQASRLTAEAELRASEARVARIELDLAESRKTAAPPRDELWAPQVGNRDFVRERLSIDSGAAQHRLASVEAAAAEADRAFRAGPVDRPVFAEAQSEVLQARREVDAVAHKLSLRKQFLDEHLAPDDVARRLQRFELMTDVERAQQLLRLAEDRLAVARERSRLGVGEPKAKQAEVAALEGSIEIEQLRLKSARTALTYRERTPAQQGIPTVDLPAASARTTEPLGAVLGVRQVSGGSVLVNDVGSRQLRVFDSTLATSIVTLDSTPGIANRYGARVPLTRYLGDSSLLPDIASRSIRVLDGRGQVARTVGLPNVPLNLSGQSFTDDKGRALYFGVVEFPQRPPFDSTPIVRVDLESRRVDTVGRVKNRNRFGPGVYDLSKSVKAFTFTDGRGGQPLTGTAIISAFALNPPSPLVPERDDWAVLSDGSIVLVRGRDYHIDWIRPDGTMSSTAQLPFDWQRLADDTKQQLAEDSARAARVAAGGVGGGRRGGGGVGDSTRRAVLGQAAYNLVVSRLADLGSIFPTMSPGSAIPDLDGNVWILPTASAPSQNGQLVYDVVNGKGQLFLRVRVPVGRSVAGFGKGSVVYLVSGDRTNGYYLEKVRVGGAK